MSLPTSVTTRVQACAALNARVARRLQAKGLDPIVWAGPTSTRTPENGRVWHPAYTQKPLALKLLHQLYQALRAAAVGLIRLHTYQGFWYRYRQQASKTLLVIPEEIMNQQGITNRKPKAPDEPGGGTNYLVETAENRFDFLIFSRIHRIGSKSEGLFYKDRVIISVILFRTALIDLFEQASCGKLTQAYWDAWFMLFRWLLTQDWHFHWEFYGFIGAFIQANPAYDQLCCLHEMHFYSKMCWRAGQEQGIHTLTAQHAMIIPEKLWYFPQSDELEAGCPTPQAFLVYNQQTANLIRAHYPQTQTGFCCSPRFSAWRDQAPQQRTPFNQGDQAGQSFQLLFVSGIMAYDVHILVEALQKLHTEIEQRSLSQGFAQQVRLVLRLHPHALSYRRDRSFIRKAQQDGVLSVSQQSLQDDLNQASLVIGCGSNVLQEAVLLGIPALSVCADDYIRPLILPEGEDWNINVNQVTLERMSEQINRIPNHELIQTYRTRLGLAQPDLSTDLIRNALQQQQLKPAGIQV